MPGRKVVRDLKRQCMQAFVVSVSRSGRLYLLPKIHKGLSSVKARCESFPIADL